MNTINKFLFNYVCLTVEKNAFWDSNMDVLLVFTLFMPIYY